MIAIYIDNKVGKFITEIRYTFDFIFRTIGLEYKYINSIQKVKSSDIIFYYGLIEPTENEIFLLANKKAMFFIPVEPDLLQPGIMKKEKIEERIKEAKFLKDVPIITEKDLEVPVVYYKNKDLFFGSFNFDLIGNIFFHLINYEFFAIDTRDRYHMLPDTASCFTDFSHKPFVNVFLWLLTQAINDSLKEREGCFLLKKSFWPDDEPFAAAISHNVETLKKWTFSNLIKSSFQDLIVFYKVKHLFINAIRRLKYIVTNIEEYWNFDLVYDIEKEYEIPATYFWGKGSEQKDELDYDLCDQEIISEIRHQMEQGKEISLLGSLNSYKEDLLQEQKRELSEIINTEKIGVRQHKLRYNPAITSEYHSKYGFLYDSTRAFTDRNGFKNGIGFPFYNFSDSPQNDEKQLPLFKKHNCLEIPLVYSDNNLRLSDVKNINYEQARDKMASLISVLKFYNGLVTFNYSIHNFADISYNKNLLKDTITQFKEHKAFIATYGGIADWWKKRNAVVIKENRNEIIVYFPDNLEKITLTLMGSFQAECIEGVEGKIIGSKLIFSNIKADSSVIVKIKQVKEKVDEKE